ncbi:TPA: baseplate protein [Enterobacter hormaechei subsp. xiangfangensis]|nr:baseplate protein [Enterobacter hormaechei subsp. xiangfangensis]HAV1890650.1 baseplate protein [Enterobacter hormaechei subsp. xiangfangensis]
MKLPGKYKAMVGNTKHPDGLMMCQVKLVTLWDGIPEEALPWAEYQLPIGAAFVPAKTGDLVWVEFPQDGDSRFPLITGACMVAPKGTPNVPPESSGKGKPFQQAQVSGAPALPVISPTADTVGRRNGLIEQRSKGGAIMFTHEKSGSRFGFNDEGEVFIYAAKNLHFYSGGTITMESVGDYTQKTAKYTLTASGDMTIKASSYSVTASAVSFKKG